MAPNPLAPVDRRPIVHLPTRTTVGWTFERSRHRPADWLDRVVDEVLEGDGHGSHRNGQLHVVPWDSTTGRWLRSRPDRVHEAARCGLTVELPARTDPTEFALAVELLLASGVPACAAFDGDVTALADLHQRDVLSAVRVPGVKSIMDGTPALGTRLGRQLTRILDEAGITVVVDGVADPDTATRLRRAGIRFAQGPAFDDLAADAPRLSVPSPVASLAYEAERLSMVRAADVLDTEPDPTLQAVVRMVTDRCGSPIAAVSIIDVERQWFQAAVGLDVHETPRHHAFCARTITGSGPLIVPDALADPRFASNPLVSGPPYVRAYLGVPLRASNGLAFGALCAIDTQARAFDADQIADVTSLASLVTDALELRVRRAGE